LRDNLVIVAGSTWEEDEEVLDHFANSNPKIRFIIAPHEIDQPHLDDIKKLFKRSVFYSTLINQETKGIPTPAEDPPNVLIIDNIGMLSRLYKYATITFVGGAFGDEGFIMCWKRPYMANRLYSDPFMTNL
jgi:3-deoxy-D-manno-octulosonic-acid transferase